MVFGLYDTSNLPFSKRLVCNFDSFSEAVEHAVLTYPLAHFEEDADHPGQAADFITAGGGIFAIEPIMGLGR